ncbi:MAG TPA: FmdB family zinc ribbon protein [Candidatus Nitrosopolaris sp.]|nr:FmdB family zinc ribbon protein [Candidatus Nitrosopolaris sp.]
MPTYGYRCSNCGHEFEIQQKMADKPLTACPECQGKLTKILYPVGISFKGSGFYTTDYKSAGKGAGASSDGVAASAESSSSSESKAETKSESKPEKKSESKSAKSDSKTEKKAS